MNRKEILESASKIVTERQNLHGKVEDSFYQIARLWESYLGIRLESIDVAHMMALLKIARAKNNPAHLDNAIDACGYMACAGEIASKFPQSTEQKEFMPPEETDAFKKMYPEFFTKKS